MTLAKKKKKKAFLCPAGRPTSSPTNSPWVRVRARATVRMRSRVGVDAGTCHGLTT